MFKMLKITLVTLSCFSMLNATASCENVIRMHIIKKFKLDSHVSLFKRSDKRLFKERKRQLRQTLLSFGSKRKQMGANRTESYRKLGEFLRTRLVERKFKKALIVFKEAIYDPKQINEWADNLYHDLVLETYIEGSQEQVEAFNLDLKLSKDLAVDVLAHRSIEGGFDGKVEVLEGFLTETEFKDLLKKKRIFLDKSAQDSGHGSLTHMLQIDYLIFAMKKARLDPKMVSEVLEWVGSTQTSIYISRSQDHFNPIFDVWATNFDGLDNGLNNPEVLNKILSNYFQFN